MEAEHYDFNSQSDPVQAYYDCKAELERHVNGCPVGLAGTLSRKGGLEIKFGKLCNTLIEAS